MCAALAKGFLYMCGFGLDLWQRLEELCYPEVESQGALMFVCGVGWEPQRTRGIGFRMCIWTPGGAPRSSKGCLDVYKMAAQVPHPKLDSPTLALTCSNGDRAFRSYKKRWRLKLLLQYKAEGFVFHMSASWLS